MAQRMDRQNMHGPTKLQPQETVLTGAWIYDGSNVASDEVTQRINMLTASFLQRRGTSNCGWKFLYQDPDDKRYWELFFPHGEMQRGGPPSLKNISEEEAVEKYNIESNY